MSAESGSVYFYSGLIFIRKTNQQNH